MLAAAAQLFWITIVSNDDSGLTSLKTRHGYSPTGHVIRPREEANYSIFTDTCRVPLFDPFDPSIEGLWYRVGEFNCEGKPPLFVVHDSPRSGRLKVDDITHSKYYENIKNCSYHEFGLEYGQDFDLWKGDTLQNVTFDRSVKVDRDFITVQCFNGSKKTYTQHNAIVRRKASLIKERRRKRKQWRAKVKPAEVLNIVIVITDSISRLNFVRHCPRTRKYLLDDLGGFEMLGYNKAGLNTYPNLTPILTGISAKEAKQRGLNHTVEVDSPQIQPPIPFIWKFMKEAGYVTLFCEDWPQASAYNYYGRRGFILQPTDFYWRPFALQAETGYCLGSEPYINYQLNYTKAFLRKYKDMPKFSLTFNSRPTHDYPDDLGKLDSLYLDFTKTLHEEGHLNNTLLIFMGDHGSRFGKLRQSFIGMMEDRMNLMTMILPRWFLKKYPAIDQALQVNTKRLATHYDMHATFESLLSFTGEVPREDTPQRGHSLFGELSDQRTCEKVGIPEQYCSCNGYIPVNTDDVHVREGADIALTFLNSVLKPVERQCYLLSLSNITDARRGYQDRSKTPPENGEGHSENSVSVVYQITFIVDPSKGVFEAIIRHRVSDNTYEIIGMPDRTNGYGSESDCMSSVVLRNYCLCKK